MIAEKAPSEKTFRRQSCGTWFFKNTATETQAIGASPRTSHWLTYAAVPILFNRFPGSVTSVYDVRAYIRAYTHTGLPTFATMPVIMKKVDAMIIADRLKKKKKNRGMWQKGSAQAKKRLSQGSL